MSNPSSRLIHEFTYHSIVSAPNEVGVGPSGKRQYLEVTNGVLDGPRLKGKQLGAGSDWMLIGTDGFMRMNVRIQIATEHGAIICATYSGPAEANQTMVDGLATSTPTAFSDQSIRTHWLLETGDPRYGWVNRTVFIGEGRLRPGSPGVLGFEHRVYRLG